MSLIDEQTCGRIRDLNDALRKTLDPALGRTTMTAGVSVLPNDVRAMALRKVAAFDSFDSDLDPQGIHDFGKFDLAGQKFFFKIDAYGPNLKYDPDGQVDSAKSTRVLTLMLAEEY